MPSSKVVHARKPGWCDGDFAHPGEIRVGDATKITTFFPGDEHVRDFGVRAFTRSRRCQWCVLREEEETARRNGVGFIAWVDRQGDVWELHEDGLMHSHETAPFPREHVEKKWGPLRLARTADHSERSPRI